ncbi:MAG: endonuclease MutS2 [Lachnospiraceae bacterium]|nr:endonuclease MutS2 [Lachnospiraceae bacterium]
MNTKVLSVLEYNKITQKLADYASSAPGKDMCLKLVPLSDIDQIEEAQINTQDAFNRLIRKDGINFGSNKDVTLSMKSLEIGASLSAPELLLTAKFLANVNRVKAYGRKEKPDEPDDSLTGFFEELEPLTQIAEEINRCILSEDEIADDASTTLKKIRRDISATNDKIHSQLTSMLSGSVRSYLQDAVITMRDNRYCIPVKAEYKSQVPGMIHDQSSTGSTVFIEPAAVVNLNNKIRELLMEEQKEIEVILADLSAKLGEYPEQIIEDQKIMTRLDFIFAKGRLAIEQNASRPVFNTEHIINIRKARHPLLPKDKVVPIDIKLGEEFDLLIVTGPNTGGKTVSLKTVGLLSLMGQAGLHIPAGDRSRLSIFKKIYADIGDEQSIEQSLSTFSAHMKNIVAILKNADEDSLCLFDELGAGTDPTEGAALAIAILEHLHDRGIRTMATTHYSELKVYALSTSFVENACCEFDVETLSPTYRLLIGIPGKSNAFAISKRLGLKDNIIEAAKLQIEKDKESFEDLISDLETKRVVLERDREEISQSKKRIKELEQALEKKQNRIDEQKENILRQAREEAREILQDAKETADDMIMSLNKANQGIDVRELEKKRSELRGKIGQTNSKLSLNTEKPKNKSLKPEKLKLGDDVKVLSMGLKGIVNSLPDSKGNLFVQCGIIRTKVNISDLELIKEDSIKETVSKKNRSNMSQIKMSKSYSISPEINLLGRTVDEAIHELDKYLDDAYLAHLPSVRIVHGKGTGALRNAVVNHLKRVKYVASFRQGEFGEGDAGVTIAVFKEN